MTLGCRVSSIQVKLGVWCMVSSATRRAWSRALSSAQKSPMELVKIFRLRLTALASRLQRRAASQADSRVMQCLGRAASSPPGERPELVSSATGSFGFRDLLVRDSA